MLEGNDLTAVEEALASARSFVETKFDSRVVTINAWNEWYEGGYREPDEDRCTGYFETIDRIFG